MPRQVPKDKDANYKLNLIRALYYIVYNSEEDIVPLASELFHALGEILEGIPAEKLSLHRINKHTLQKELSSGD